MATMTPTVNVWTTLVASAPAATTRTLTNNGSATKSVYWRVWRAGVILPDIGGKLASSAQASFPVQVGDLIECAPAGAASGTCSVVIV